LAQDRREDWHDGVDARLASLTSAQRTTDDQLDDGEIRTTKLEQVVFGDPAENIAGLTEQLHSIQTELTRLIRLIDPDYAGKHGLLKDVAYLMDRDDVRKRREERSRMREGWAWESVTKIIVEFLLVVGLLILNWERVEDFARSAWGHLHHSSATAQVAKAAKAKKGRKKKPIVLPEFEGDPTGSEVQ